MNSYKLFGLLFCQLILFSGTAWAQSDQEQLQQLIQGSFDDIFSEFDTSQIHTYYTPDFILLEHGEVWNNEKIKDYMLKAASKPERAVRTNRFEFIEVKVSGSTAWMAYHNYATLTQESGQKRELYWLESATAVRDGQAWKLDMLHSTRRPPE